MSPPVCWAWWRGSLRGSSYLALPYSQALQPCQELLEGNDCQFSLWTKCGFEVLLVEDPSLSEEITNERRKSLSHCFKYINICLKSLVYYIQRSICCSEGISWWWVLHWECTIKDLAQCEVLTRILITSWKRKKKGKEIFVWAATSLNFVQALHTMQRLFTLLSPAHHSEWSCGGLSTCLSQQTQLRTPVSETNGACALYLTATTVSYVSNHCPWW